MYWYLSNCFSPPNVLVSLFEHLRLRHVEEIFCLVSCVDRINGRATYCISLETNLHTSGRGLEHKQVFFLDILFPAKLDKLDQWPVIDLF